MNAHGQRKANAAVEAISHYTAPNITSWTSVLFWNLLLLVPTIMEQPSNEEEEKPDEPDSLGW